MVAISIFQTKPSFFNAKETHLGSCNTQKQDKFSYKPDSNHYCHKVHLLWSLPGCMPLNGSIFIWSTVIVLPKVPGHETLIVCLYLNMPNFLVWKVITTRWSNNQISWRACGYVPHWHWMHCKPNVAHDLSNTFVVNWMYIWYMGIVQALVANRGQNNALILLLHSFIALSSSVVGCSYVSNTSRRREVFVYISSCRNLD